MKSIASAPGKVILFGEHFVVHGNKAVLCSIDKRITVTSKFIDEKKIRLKSGIINDEVPIDSSLQEINKFLKPFVFLVSKILPMSNKNCGVELEVDSEIPPGVGLGSSSALCVAAASSISGLVKKLSKDEILRLAIEAERTIFENTSGADCSVCTFGGLAEYDIKNGFKKIEAQIDLNFVIANSNESHETNEVVSKVKNFQEKNKELFDSLYEQESQIIHEALEALSNNNLIKIGSLMSRNQVLLEGIGVSTEKLAKLVKEAKKTCLGAKITGAGGGGCIITLVDNSNISKTISNLKNYSDVFIAKIDHKGLVDTF